jgi:hypothetical protein
MLTDFHEERIDMEYQLKIYRPGSCDEGDCIKFFNESAPFMPIRVGDLLNAAAWGKDASDFRLLRVQKVEHLISEKSGAGINPSGSTLQRILIYTEWASDLVETSSQIAAAT